MNNRKPISHNAVTRRHDALERLVLDALFAALTLVLGLYLTVRVGNIIEISLSSLPVLFAAFLFGTADALAVAFVGSFLEQLILFGIGPTTPIWMAPMLLLALLAGLLSLPVRRQIRNPLRRRIALAAVTVIAELIFSLSNTVALFLDAWIYHYSVAALATLLPARLANWGVRTVITALAIWFLLPPVQKLFAMRKNT